MRVPNKISISLDDLPLIDLEFLFENSKEITIDGDSRTVIIEEPSEILLEELESRAIKVLRY